MAVEEVGAVGAHHDEVQVALVFDVEVVTPDNKVFDVKVDAADGKVLSSKLDQADRGEKDED